MLCLCCHAQAFSSCGRCGPLFVGMRGLLAAVVYSVAERGLSRRVHFSGCHLWALEHGLSSCGTQAELPP